MQTITIFDWTVIAIVGLSGLLALFRGFIREVLSLATWLIAAIITINYYDDVKVMLAKHVSSKLVLMGLSTVGLYIALLVVFAIITSIIMRFLQGSGGSVLDSLLGMAFGVLRGLFILALCYLMVSVVMPEEEFPEAVKNGITLPVVRASAHALGGLAPGYMGRLKDMSEDAKKQGEQLQELNKQMEQLEKANKAQEGGKAAPAPKKYDEQERKKLERLLESLQREGIDPEVLKQLPQEKR